MFNFLLGVAVFAIVLLVIDYYQRKNFGKVVLLKDLAQVKREIFIAVTADGLINWADPQISTSLRSVANHARITVIVGQNSLVPTALQQLSDEGVITLRIFSASAFQTKWLVDNNPPSLVGDYGLYDRLCALRQPKRQPVTSLNTTA